MDNGIRLDQENICEEANYNEKSGKIKKLAEITTREVVECKSLSVIDELIDSYSVIIPWVPYRANHNSIFDFNKCNQLSLAVQSMREEVENQYCAGDLADYNYQLGAKIFENKTDFLLETSYSCSISKIKNNVWNLYFAYEIAGLSPVFVIIPNDILGNASLDHVALSIQLDQQSGASVVVDPKYGKYNVQGSGEIPIDDIQAVSMFYTHEALCSATPKADLELAIDIDPSNIVAISYLWHAMAKTVDPLRPFREYEKILELKAGN